jgi:hypothetical protein
METYRDLEVEKVEWLATDDGTCDICPANADLGPVEIGYEFDSIEGGTTEPPAHPNCRCAILPALDNEPDQPQADQEEEPLVEDTQPEETASDIEQANLEPVAVDLPEAEQASTEGSVTDHGGTERPVPPSDLPLNEDLQFMTKEEQREVFNNLYNTFSFTAADGKTYTAEVSRNIKGFDSASVGGKILDPDGKTVGEFSRTYWSNDLENWVDHNLLRIDTDQRGLGIGRAFSDYSETAYKQMGIEEIHVEAGLTDGGYTWAKAGYDWSPDNDFDYIQDHLEYKAQELMTSANQFERYIATGAISDEDKKLVEEFGGISGMKDYAKMIDRIAIDMRKLEGLSGSDRIAAVEALPKPFEIANIEGPQISGPSFGRSRPVSFGRYLLAGSGWDGVKKLD